MGGRFSRSPSGLTSVDIFKTSFMAIEREVYQQFKKAIDAMPSNVPMPRVAFIADPLLKDSVLTHQFLLHTSTNLEGTTFVNQNVHDNIFTKTSGISTQHNHQQLISSTVADKYGSLLERILHYTLPTGGSSGSGSSNGDLQLLEAVLLTVFTEMHATTEQLSASCVYEAMASRKPFDISSEQDYSDMIAEQTFLRREAFSRQLEQMSEEYEEVMAMASNDERDHIDTNSTIQAVLRERGDTHSLMSLLAIDPDAEVPRKDGFQSYTSDPNAKAQPIFNRRPPKQLRQIEMMDNMVFPLFESIRIWLVSWAGTQSTFFKSMLSALHACEPAQHLMNNILRVNNNTLYVGIWLSGAAEEQAIEQLRVNSRLSEENLMVLLSLRRHIRGTVPIAMSDDVSNYISLDIAQLPYEEDPDVVISGKLHQGPRNIRFDVLQQFVAYYVYRGLTDLISRERNALTQLPVLKNMDARAPSISGVSQSTYNRTMVSADDNYNASTNTHDDDDDNEHVGCSFGLSGHSGRCVEWYLRENGVEIPRDVAKAGLLNANESSQSLTVHITEIETSNSLVPRLDAPSSECALTYVSVTLNFTDTSYFCIAGKPNEPIRVYPRSPTAEAYGDMRTSATIRYPPQSLSSRPASAPPAGPMMSTGFATKAHTNTTSLPSRTPIVMGSPMSQMSLRTPILPAYAARNNSDESNSTNGTDHVIYTNGRLGTQTPIQSMFAPRSEGVTPHSVFTTEKPARVETPPHAVSTTSAVTAVSTQVQLEVDNSDNASLVSSTSTSTIGDRSTF